MVLQSAPIKYTSNDISKENDLPQTSRNKITNHPHPRWTICYFCFTFFFVTDTKYSLHPLWFVFALFFFRFLRFFFLFVYRFFIIPFWAIPANKCSNIKYSSNNKGATLVSTKSVASKKSNQKSRTHVPEIDHSISNVCSAFQASYLPLVSSHTWKCNMRLYFVYIDKIK